MDSNGENHVARIAVSGRGSGRWSLVRRTGLGADVLAHSANVPDGSRRRRWQVGVARLRDGEGTLSVRATGDGHFQWVLTAPEDSVIAESPPVYRDPDSCRDAFADAQRAARSALGPVQHDVTIDGHRRSVRA